MSADKPRRLGRGLEALLASTQAATPTEADESALRQLPIAQIRPNPYQPRKEFKPEELADLEASIRATGLLQPVTVRPAPGGARGFELIAGERRLRAATRIGWTEIPAIVKDIDDRTLLTFGLVENLQRADLNPVEEAEGYQRLIDEFDLTQQQVADVIGKDRSTIANMLRVLALPAAVRRMLQEGAISLGHARALLALGSEHAITDLARETVAKQLNVREVERRAREGGAKRKPERPATTATAEPASRNAEARRIEDQLRRHLQTDVHLSVKEKERGEITIAFYSNEDLSRVLELLLGGTGDAL
jgi:ParB family transcriptional regulator, chromosome partitioning protein